jgi:mannose/fructose-specific phosphotransferase system component IIA
MLSATNSNSYPVQSTPPSSECAQANLSAACELLALMVQSQSTTQAGSKNDVELDFKKMEELKKQLADAIQQAKDAANHSGFLGFLGDIFGGDVAQIAGAVAAVAAVVATGGAAGPLLLVALAEGLQAAAKYGPQLGIDPKICMALGVASVAVGVCTGAGSAQAFGAVADGARSVELGAHVTQAASTATGGALHFAAGHYQAKSLAYQADATGYQAANDTTSLDLDAALDMLQHALQTEQRETTTVSAITQDNANTNAALSNRI